MVKMHLIQKLLKQHQSIVILSQCHCNSVNYLYLVINKTNGYIEENNGNEYLTLVPTDESKYILEKFEELSTKMGGLVRSKTNRSNNYDEKYMNI